MEPKVISASMCTQLREAALSNRQSVGSGSYFASIALSKCEFALGSVFSLSDETEGELLSLSKITYTKLSEGITDQQEVESYIIRREGPPGEGGELLKAEKTRMFSNRGFVDHEKLGPLDCESFTDLLSAFVREGKDEVSDSCSKEHDGEKAG